MLHELTGYLASLQHLHDDFNQIKAPGVEFAENREKLHQAEYLEKAKTAKQHYEPVVLEYRKLLTDLVADLQQVEQQREALNLAKGQKCAEAKFAEKTALLVLLQELLSQA